MPRNLWMALMAAAAASGCSDTTNLENLSTPALVWTQTAGLCSKIVAVDGARSVWTNQGCEGDGLELSKGRTATQAQVDDLWTKFAALPGDEGATVSSCSGNLDVFERWDAEARTRTSACSGAKYDDAESLPEPFQPLAGALRALE